MNDFLELLKEMGATRIKYEENEGCDDILSFIFKNKKVFIQGVHYNDSTGGIEADVSTMGEWN